MTVCLAYYDKNTNQCWIGADSCASDSISHSIVSNHKCFNPVGRRDVVMACAGTFRLPNLLQFIPDIFPDECDLPTEKIDMSYLVNEFIPILEALTKDFDDDDVWELLVAVNKKIYRVQMDYSIVESADDADAIGVGGMVALGAFKTLNDLKPDMPVEDQIKYALDVACNSCQGCMPPFVVKHSEELPADIKKSKPNKRKSCYQIVRHKEELNIDEDIVEDEEDDKSKKDKPKKHKRVKRT